MAKRKRKSLTPRRKRKQQVKAVNEQNVNENSINNEEAWTLNEFASLDDLRNTNGPGCDSEECNLKALHVYEGQVSKSLWYSCIDCQLSGYEDWPSIDECKDACDNLPFTSEIDEIVRKMCTSKYNIELPSCMSCKPIDETTVNIVLNEEPPLNDGNNDSNEINQPEDSNDKQSNDNEVIVTRNEGTNNNKDRKRQDKSRNEFSFEMKQLERKGLVQLDPKVVNKETGKLCEPGLCVICNVCKRFRPNSDGIINLRRPYYPYYYFNHTQNKAHLTSKALHDRQEKLINKNGATSKSKTHTQSMISSFMVKKVKENKTKATTNNTSKASNTPSNFEKDTSNKEAPAAEEPTIAVDNNKVGTR